MKNEERIDLLLRIFDNQQNLISNADTKSSISIGIQSFVLTTILGASIISKTFALVLKQSWIEIAIYVVLFFSFLITSVFALTYCIYTICPRTPKEKQEIKRNGISYFGHISKFKSSETYLDKIKEIETEEVIKEFSCQNYNLALILEQKMKNIRLSTNLLFANILIGILLLVFSILIN